MEQRISVLSYAVRGRVILKYGGQLALMLALLTLAPLGFSLLESEWARALRYAVICVGLLLGGGYLARLSAPDRLQANEALSIVAAAFLLSPLLMSWPMMAGDIGFVDALFEAVSGVTTTGLSTLGSVEHRPAGFLFARAWMQWYGGLGIVVLSVALLMGHHIAARRLADPAGSGEMLVGTVRIHARHSLIAYLGLTLLGLVVVWPLTGNGFDALLHVLAAVSTGGFSRFDASLAGLGSMAAVAIMAISFLGAVSLPLYWRVIQAGWGGGWRTLAGDVELRALLGGALLVSALLSGLAWQHGVEAPWYHGLMMGFSAQTTTGFGTLPVAEMDPVSKLVMIMSMLVGGSIGSSAGGFKLLRLLILLRMLQLMIRRSSMPTHAVAEPYLAGQKLETDDLLRALQLILLFIGIMFLSWLPFVALGYDPLDALFEVASATGTVGLSTGIARPELETVLKGVLCFDMLAGRLEIVALLVVLYPRNWLGRREEST
ncbi:MAG: potassium transporter TrkG [Gammaproteobacteria bacterium]|nr:potassium transporter TrkG [Gammaproteobacteria bacterium]